MRKFGFVILISALFVAGCAGFMTFTPEAQQKLETYGQWADKWIGGAVKNAPVIIAGVEAVMGANEKTKAAYQAVSAAQDALGVYHAAVAVGSADEAAKQVALANAIETVKATVGDVQKIQASLKNPS